MEIILHEGETIFIYGDKMKNAPYVVAFALDGGVVNRLDNERGR